jgi:hypothetical protein
VRGHRCNGLMSLAAALPKVRSYSWPSSAAAHSFEHVNAAIQRQGRERRHRQRIAALMIRPRLRTVRGMASVVRQRKHPSNSVASCFEVEVCANRASSLFEPRSKAPIGRGPLALRLARGLAGANGTVALCSATERTSTSAG